ncbi:hypothetical protein [Streptosporangium sp. NPDC003464]
MSSHRPTPSRDAGASTAPRCGPLAEVAPCQKFMAAVVAASTHAHAR